MAWPQDGTLQERSISSNEILAAQRDGAAERLVRADANGPRAGVEALSPNPVSRGVSPAGALPESPEGRPPPWPRRIPSELRFLGAPLRASELQKLQSCIPYRRETTGVGFPTRPPGRSGV